MVAGKDRLDVGFAHRKRLCLHLVKAEYFSETHETWITRNVLMHKCHKIKSSCNCYKSDVP